MPQWAPCLKTVAPALYHSCSLGDPRVITENSQNISWYSLEWKNTEQGPPRWGVLGRSVLLPNQLWSSRHTGKTRKEEGGRALGNLWSPSEWMLCFLRGLLLPTVRPRKAAHHLPGAQHRPIDGVPVLFDQQPCPTRNCFLISSPFILNQGPGELS